MSQMLINKQEIVDDARLIPADEWNEQRYAQFSAQKWRSRLLFLLLIVQTLIFGPWLTLCPGCSGLYSVPTIALFNYLVLGTFLLSFAMTICIFCYLESATTFFAERNLLLSLLGYLPIVTYTITLVFMFWYSVFTDSLDLNGKAHECLAIQGVLCVLCAISGYISKTLLTVPKEESIDIRSFHSCSVIAAHM